MFRSLRANTVARSQSITSRSGRIRGNTFVVSGAGNFEPRLAGKFPLNSGTLATSIKQRDPVSLLFHGSLPPILTQKLKHMRRIAGFAQDQCGNMPASHG